MKKRAVVHFKVKNLSLTAEEKKVVDKLVEAAEAIAPIYEKQENPQYPGANFYPHDVTKEEILEAVKQNPNILSPYTVVERGKNRELIAVPYHVKYKSQLEKVARLIKDAAKMSENKNFASGLRVQANALLDGNYDAAQIYWLTMKPHKIDFVIGPIERYNDQLFFTKCSCQAWVGVWDEILTEDAVKFKNYIVSARRKILTPSEKVDFLDKIQIRVDDTLLFSGLIAQFMFTSSNLPNDVNLMEEHGSEVTIFKPSFKKKFDKEYHPIFHAVFEEKFQKGYPVPVLKLGSLRNSYLHEISHPLLRYRDAERRLKEYFPIFDEIAASVYGIKSCGSLLLKDVISQKELEAIMVMFIAKAFSWWITYLREPGVTHYAQGFAIAINFFLESGALRESRGFYWPNFTKLFVSIDELSDTLERILAIGTYEDARKFIEKHASLKTFEYFRPNLEKLL
ncbi:MAG: hypothetical protein AAB639_03170 [Patescibacteria group bacterium]